ncbi:hypothetical protein JAAARDRAFT_209546 [Jaapia argillacea MUCL 33604]|uniref:Uncharacterized protein n=1 Tax=Jaapia argillacea MUCL 33604 TaxID=933084 RepID=A0A067PGM6_9AGAM|nr:hypothetical protein JAAARDRAFT_209546 [Jaapia argillacea MUCL 33604]
MRFSSTSVVLAIVLGTSAVVNAGVIDKREEIIPITLVEEITPVTVHGGIGIATVHGGIATVHPARATDVAK